MEISTPVNSPKRKKHSLIQNFIPEDETLGDIESEIQTRRLKAINKSTESRRRLSAAPLLAGYTASQLAQHCKDVIKLSTENKINCKNAFSFWLIDVMADMAKKHDSEINKNFQVASCTLDASVKIYGYRVDAIHTDAVKMAGGFFTKEAAEGGGDGDGGSAGGKDGENDEEGAEENAVKSKVKKKRKKLTVVPPESLNAKSEVEVLLDTIPQQNFLTRKTSGNDLLIKIPKYNDGGLLQLDPEDPCWPTNEGETSLPKSQNKEKFDHASLTSLFGDVKVSKDEQLCPDYSNFQFGKGCEQHSDSEDELHASQNSGRFEFDINASIQYADVDVENEPEEQRNRIHIPAGGFDSDEDIDIQPEKPKIKQNFAISDMKTRISVNPSEYSMFDEKIFKAWAGPAHWKVRPTRKILEEFDDNEDRLKPIASKRTRKGKVKTSSGLFDIDEKVLAKNMAECEKTTLFKSTMLNWSPQNTTMPEDLKCRAKNFFCLYHFPSFSVVSDVSSGKEDGFSEISDHNDAKGEDGEEGMESEGEELEYCSASVALNGNEEEDQNLEAEDDKTWDLGNMVEAPNRVEKIAVSSFKRRKHVDIRHLKKGLWSVLTEGSSEVGAAGKAAVTNSIEFGELVKVFPSKVPKSFGSLLSPPLIFNALLHLTNENSLVLTQDKTNKLNFVISQ